MSVGEIKVRIEIPWLLELEKEAVEAGKMRAGWREKEARVVRFIEDNAGRAQITQIN
ncbi:MULTISPECIES: hypothetical protein [Paenibacillus]|uniref:hypothetical protein n=1 Tax=Paenibacillus TaxID=44249 RepID=UPI0015BEE622|nr:hypothetical protein [Paenibacillus odorifer]